MEEFNIISKRIKKLNSLKRLLESGLGYIPELQTYIDKIVSITSSVKDGEISVVLLGSFSDGKTSAIAGLLGRLEDNMKIYNDMSLRNIPFCYLGKLNILPIYLFLLSTKKPRSINNLKSFL